jgi:hypothetical protein
VASKWGPNVNLKGKYGRIALSWAARSRQRRW